MYLTEAITQHQPTTEVLCRDSASQNSMCRLGDYKQADAADRNNGIAIAR